MVNSLLSLEDQSGIVHLRELRKPSCLLESKEEISALMKMIDELPGKQKDVILLCKIESRSMKETAEILRTSVKAIESLLGRAKKKLKERLIQREITERMQIMRKHE